MLLLLAAGGTAVALEVKDDNDVEAASAAAERRQQELERSSREFVIKDLEKAVTDDARKTAASGVLDGPVIRTECTPVGGVVDVAAITQEVECFAEGDENADGTPSGYDYTATVNYSELSFTWQPGP